MMSQEYSSNMHYLPREEILNQLNHYISDIRHMVKAGVNFEDVDAWLQQRDVKVPTKMLKSFIGDLKVKLNISENAEIIEKPEETQEEEPPKCPRCNSTNLVRNGKQGVMNRRQRYSCNECGRNFVEPENKDAHEKKKDKIYSCLKTTCLTYYKRPVSVNELRKRDRTFRGNDSYRLILKELIDEKKVKMHNFKKRYYYWPVEIEDQIKMDKFNSEPKPTRLNLFKTPELHLYVLEMFAREEPIENIQAYLSKEGIKSESYELEDYKKEYRKTIEDIKANIGEYDKLSNTVLKEVDKDKKTSGYEKLDKCMDEINHKIITDSDISILSSWADLKRNLESKNLIRDILVMFGANIATPGIMIWLEKWNIKTTYDALLRFKEEYKAEIKLIEKEYHGVIEKFHTTILEINKLTNDPPKVQIKNGKYEHEYVKINSMVYNRLLADREYLEKYLGKKLKELKKLKEIKSKTTAEIQNAVSWDNVNFPIMPIKDELSEIFNVPGTDFIFNCQNKDSFLQICKTLNDHAIDFEMITDSQKGKYGIFIPSWRP